MFFKIGALKNFEIFTGKHFCWWSLFLIKLQAFRCFPVNIAEFLSAAFFIEHFRWLLLQMLCFTLYFQKDVAERIVAIHCITVSFWNLKLISFAFIRFHSLCYLFSFVVTRCHSLSFVVPLVVICFHPLSFVVTSCNTRCHSLSLVLTQCTTRLSFYKVYLLERFHFHIKSIYFTFKKVGCSYLTVFLFTKTNVFYELC